MATSFQWINQASQAAIKDARDYIDTVGFGELTSWIELPEDEVLNDYLESHDFPEELQGYYKESFVNAIEAFNSVEGDED